jgi:DNA primase large subunit
MAISIALEDLVKYPFLPQVREYLQRIDLDLETISDLPPVRERAKQRIAASFSLESVFTSKPNSNTQAEIASYPYAIMIASAVEDPLLIQRFALHEAQQVNYFLKLEKREELILEIAKAFSWQTKVDSNGVWLHFSKFLKNTSTGRLMHDKTWKLINRSLDQGWVAVTFRELSRLLQEEVKEKIEETAKQKLTIIPAFIKADVEEITTEFIKNKPHLVEYDLKVYAQESEYPPCIAILLTRATEGKHLSHTERFTLVTYLLHQGISIDSIVNLFSNVSDFKEDKTRYQVENLAGKTSGRTEGYTTYNCSTLQSHGVCSNPTDPICRIINNPLTYHLLKQKIMGKPIPEQSKQ